MTNSTCSNIQKSSEMEDNLAAARLEEIILSGAELPDLAQAMWDPDPLLLSQIAAVLGPQAVCADQEELVNVSPNTREDVAVQASVRRRSRKPKAPKQVEHHLVSVCTSIYL